MKGDPAKALCAISLLLAVAGASTPAFAQIAETETEAAPAPAIDAADERPTDQQIQAEINDIFGQIESLADVEASVRAGVVTLSGLTATAEAAARAEALASRINGVATVENKIERDVSVDSRLAPALDEAQSSVRDAVKYAPLVLLAASVFAAIAGFGWLITRWSGFWRRVTPNAFIAEVAATTVRVGFFIGAAVAALSLLDANALIGAFLGAAGVLGLAVGFAVRDTIENYIASIMLSLRQPFRPNDHVVIDGREGRVIRLTSRATVLMTLDGNHLRIPNATVFKSVILNYSRNPDRRFDFELGVDADDDPLAAIETGVNAMKALDFVLSEPSPVGVVQHVGDSNIVIFFAAWVDQRQADFGKSRSVAVAVVKKALEDAGFALPEPIYRLRFDPGAAPAGLKPPAKSEPADETPPPKSDVEKTPSAAAHDTRPDTDLEEKVNEERRETGEADLLDDAAPIE